jgi:hypothetical protein
LNTGNKIGTPNAQKPGPHSGPTRFKSDSILMAIIDAHYTDDNHVERKDLKQLNSH